MEDSTLRRRLWDGFARLQVLLGACAPTGRVIEEPDVLVASLVPDQPDSPALNAVVAIEPDATVERLPELDDRYRDAGVRRFGVWVDGGARRATQALQRAGLAVASAAPGMGAPIDAVPLDDAPPPTPADLHIVGHINDRAYGNQDGRLERTLARLPPDALHGYRTDLDGRPAACALALHHAHDCGFSFVATVPEARRRGLATQVMQSALTDAARSGCDSVTLQATAQGERLYERLNLRRLGSMELWEHR